MLVAFFDSSTVVANRQFTFSRDVFFSLMRDSFLFGVMHDALFISVNFLSCNDLMFVGQTISTRLNHFGS